MSILSPEPSPELVPGTQSPELNSELRLLY